MAIYLINLLLIYENLKLTDAFFFLSIHFKIYTRHRITRIFNYGFAPRYRISSTTWTVFTSTFIIEIFLFFYTILFIHFQSIFRMLLWAILWLYFKYPLMEAISQTLALMSSAALRALSKFEILLLSWLSFSFEISSFLIFSFEISSFWARFFLMFSFERRF